MKRRKVIQTIQFISLSALVLGLAAGPVNVHALSAESSDVPEITMSQEQNDEMETAQSAPVEDEAEEAGNLADSPEAPAAAAGISPQGFIGNADKSITTLMLKALGTDWGRKTEFSYAPGPNTNNPYQGGELTGFAKVPVQGNVVNRSLLPINAPELISDFQKGNYGARINVAFPKGTDAKAMFNTIDWSKSNSSTDTEFYLTAIGIPTPIKLKWGLMWDRETVLFNSAKPNEFSLMLRGINKEKVSNTEWNKWSPLVTEAALLTVGTIPGGGVLGNMNGWAEGKLYFDVGSYTGNTDDATFEKELTKGRLVPSETRKLDMEIHVLDQDSLTAGTQGKGDIGKALVIPGHEYDNLQKDDRVETWDSYLSIWDQEGVYNTNLNEEPEVRGVGTALPGISLFERDLIVDSKDDFNSFKADRFNRVVNYFTKQDVTKGNIGYVSRVELSHLPTKVRDNVKTPVTYTGTIHYLNGDVRYLIPNVMNVTNKSETLPNTGGKIYPDTYTIDDKSITGTYEGDVAKLEVFVNGTSAGKGGVLDSNKKFTFNLNNQKIAFTDFVTMSAYDKNDKPLQENVRVALIKPNYTGTIAPHDYNLSNSPTTITGTYTGDVSTARVFINGVAQSWGGTFANGSFSYYIGSKISTGNETVTISAYDKNRNVLQENVPVRLYGTPPNPPTPVGTITPNRYSIGDTSISGSYTGAVKKARVFINGSAQAWGGSFTNGTFSYYVGANRIKAGDTVTISAYDQNDRPVQERVSVPMDIIPNTGIIRSAKYTLGTMNINGIYEGAVKKARVYINGVAQAWGGSFSSDGTFSYYIGAGRIKEGDEVRISGYDQNDQLLDDKKLVQVEKQSTEPEKFTSATYRLGDVTIAGTYEGNIVRARVFVNGNPQAWGGTFANGRFSYYIGAGKISAGDSVRIVGYNALNDEVSSIAVTGFN